MKTPFASLLVAIALCGASHAIPQTFGNGFFGAVGQQFEDFAVAAIGPGAELKGQWAPVVGKKNEMRLEMTAVVFGVPASEVVSVKGDSGIEKYRVLYRADDDRKRAKPTLPLRDRVLAGIRAYTGSEVKGPVVYKGARLSVADGAKGDVTVEIAKAP